MHPKERAIKEKRLYQATRNNYMGAAGKIGQIAKWLGTPIIRQGSGMMDATYLEDPYKTPSEDIPVAEDEHHCMEGWLFDGLGRGLHLEIKYTHSDKKLTVDYKGYRVYTEVAGDLDSYAPFPEWESVIEMLYKRAKERQKKVEVLMKAEEDISMMGKAKNFLQMLRFKWGI